MTFFLKKAYLLILWF